MSDIRPIDLPTAAGQEFGQGDVRHFSEEDSVNVPGLQNPTRQLAERDNKLAAKLNEVVAEVNNKEQFVPLPIPRTAIPASVEEVVYNFQIPDGYEARLLSAAVASSPASSDLTLKVYYSTGYGNTSGTELISTKTSWSGGVAFYNTGELIVAVDNDGASSLDAIATVVLTIRPIGSTASLLVGSVIQGARGYTGGKGDKGNKGDPGVGGAGTPGLSWTGTFSDATSYAPPQAVYYTRENGAIESYIATAANPSPPNHPTDSAFWDPLAAGGVTGGITWRGTWVGGTPYYPNDAVYYSGSSYICTSAVTSATNPATDTANWDILALEGTDGAAGTAISFTSQPGTIDTADGGGYSSSTTQGDYAQFTAGNTIQMDEYAIRRGPDDGYPGRWVTLVSKNLVVMSGTLSITTPTSYYTAAQYTSANLQVTAVAHGDQYVEAGGNHAEAVRIDWPSATQVDIIVAESVGEQKVQINATGWQQN